MKKLCLPALLVGSLIVAGCRTLPEEPAAPVLPERPSLPVMERKPGDYAVEIRVMDMTASSKNLLYTNPNLYADQIYAAPDTQTVPLPVFHMAAGETGTVDARTSLAYPAAFDEAGDATEYKADTIGTYATVKLRLDQKRGLVLDLKVEDSNPVWMREFVTPSGERYARPVCETVSVQTQGLVGNLNEWTVLTGGSIPVERQSLTRDKRVETQRFNVWRIVLARVVRPSDTP